MSPTLRSPDDIDPAVMGNLIRAMRTFANENELYVGAKGREHAIHRTDLAGLAVIMDQSSQGVEVTPGLLSRSMVLSPSATSAMLDRLEEAGHVHRRPHEDDRRSVVIEMTERAHAVGQAMFGPLGRRLAALMAQYSEAELVLVTEFLDRANEVMYDVRNSP